MNTPKFRLSANSNFTKVMMVAGLIGVTLPSLGFANVTYTYTGNNFIQVPPPDQLAAYGISDSPYTTSMSVSGSFELASALSASMPLTAITPLAYTFSDGYGSFAGNAGRAVFQVSTDASGNIDQWYIDLAYPVYYGGGGDARYITTMHYLNAPGYVTGYDLTQDIGGFAVVGLSGGTGYLNGSNWRQAGTWTATAAAVPEPEAWGLMLSGLGLVGWAARRRKTVG